MLERRRRTFAMAVVVLAAIPLVVAATAFACARLATLKLDRATARGGVEVKAVGRNFNSDPKASPVVLRLNSRTGTALWSGRPDSRGRFRATFTVPKAAAGYYVVLATQTVASGAPAAGTPGRAPLRLLAGSSAASRTEAAPAPFGGAGAPPASAPMLIGLSFLVLVLGAGALALTSGGRRASPARTSIGLPA